MNNENTGGPAFPVLHWISGESTGAEEGMTLHDYFAARATEQDIKSHEQADGPEAKGVDTLGNEWKRPSIIYYTREQAKYRYADAMLKARGA